MYRVLACVFEQHNLWLVGVAALICVAGCAGAVYVLDGARAGETPTRQRWLFLAALALGAGTWATHFVAMLGYDVGIPHSFDLSWTLLSALVAVGGIWGAFTLYDLYSKPAGVIGAGLLIGVSIAGMHYFGMRGVEAAAQRVWASDLVVASCVLSVSLAIAAMCAFSRLRNAPRVITTATLFGVGIVALHFTSMGALTLIPDPRMITPEGLLDVELMALTVAVSVALVLCVAVLLSISDRRITAVELAAAKQAAEMARHDALTGLPNRRHLLEALDSRVASLPPGEKLAVIAVDLDRFKPVNDLYGHAVGDQLLVKIGRMLSGEAGEDGFVARLGGDEFILLLPYENVDALIARLSALLARFEVPIELAEHEASVGATLGIALAPADGIVGEVLMRRADVALYRGKDEGRGRFAFFESGMDRRVHERAQLEHALRAAVRADQITPNFQPLVHLETGNVLGYEVLARWNSPAHGNVPPEVFVRIAEQTGLVGELTFNLLRRACREALNWAGAPPISLNISPVQLQDAALPQKLLRVLSETGFPAGRLEIEITEDALVNDFDAAHAVLTSLKNLGVRIALDDFGTGYSSLRHLRELPFDSLKIDRSFVHTMGESEESLTIVRTVVQLAKSLGLGVTAEGIETKQQADELRALGCELGQGFLLGRPEASKAGRPRSATSAA